MSVFFNFYVIANTSARPQKLSQNIFNVCGKKLRLEVAADEQERATGLMYRSAIEPGTGMLFIFPSAEPRQFWMKNVNFDIDIGYFDAKGRLLNFMTMFGSSPLVREDALPRYESRGPAQFAVEAEKGFFQKIKNPGKCALRPLPKIAR